LRDGTKAAIISRSSLVSWWLTEIKSDGFRGPGVENRANGASARATTTTSAGGTITEALAAFLTKW